MSDKSLADEMRDACAEVGVVDSVTALIRYHRADAAAMAAEDQDDDDLPSASLAE